MEMLMADCRVSTCLPGTMPVSGGLVVAQAEREITTKNGTIFLKMTRKQLSDTMNPLSL
jgi:hypothetical protein